MSSTSSTVAVVGAGPGLGRAVARRFGAAGHPVALISRNAGKLRGIADSLAAEGVTARAYPADVTDEESLTVALDTAAAELGRIGVLSYNPAPTFPSEAGQVPDLAALGFTSAARTTRESVRPMFDMLVGGALTAAAAVLPAMREARDGALLFTTGTTAIRPLPEMSNSGIALAGLRSWAQGLHNDLADEGVYVGHLCIGVPIIPDSGEGDPDVLADRWYRLAQERTSFEATVGI
ncbi:SDR family oxidoreductase [Streptomyces shenzhenensis]|uniref:Short-chain dehydrogenase n=1 Tax=Streptomyces shenzhenensis TaxID=943815 RepID=A0A3M0ID53_9ACTN|nr:SDR family NAD(P)-dependent oxidoreductase [Streptomyces shenzhenensis]RMB84179.1 short-chain dehydrogenase [Streptomyces shenzhenensis]